MKQPFDRFNRASHSSAKRRRARARSPSAASNRGVLRQLWRHGPAYEPPGQKREWQRWERRQDERGRR